VLAGAALALPALAQEPPEAEEEQAPPTTIFAPERAPSAEQERPPTGQPDPAGILQQDRTPREPTAAIEAARRNRPRTSRFEGGASTPGT